MDIVTDQYSLLFGDCLERMKEIPDQSVNLILTDLPYGTTACKWDSVIPFEPMWLEVWRTLKPNCAVLFFGSEPFSTKLRMSAFDCYKYDWYWDKKKSGNFVQAKRMPLKIIENILLFSKESTLPTYHPQMTIRDKPIQIGSTKTTEAIPIKNNPETHRRNKKYYTKYPVTLLPFDRDHSRKRTHPTQKPVPLLEYLINTYTQKGDLVLDFAMGSGSTGVACLHTNRKFIGIELDEKYLDLASNRLERVSE